MIEVSVIIPTYNVCKFIDKTLDSVLTQTYSDFEVIVVDDGSTDQTVSIIKQYCGKHPEKIRLILKENSGPGSARNVGIRAAAGEYIAFIDADDLWLPQKLEKQIAYFKTQSSEVGLVYTDARKFDDDGIWVLPEKYRRKRSEGWIYKELLKRNMIPNQSVIARKKCFDDVGLFDESLELIEDHDMWLRIAMKYKIVFLDEVLSLYREQSQGRSKKVETTIKRSNGVIEKHLKMAEGNSELEDLLKNILSHRLYSLGYFYLRGGHMKDARKIFKRSYSIRFQLKTYFMKIATFVPFYILDVFNNTLKSVFKPPEIIKSKDDLKKLLEDV